MKEWEEIELFLKWEYTKNHFSLDTNDRDHFCRCALGGECHRVHSNHGYKKCCEVVTFFSKLVRPLFQHAIDTSQDEDDFREVVTMTNATLKLTDNLKHYMSHRVRSKIQFIAIEELKQWILDDIDKRIMIVLYHKQKILPMEYREGLVEYYGKRNDPTGGNDNRRCP